MANTFVQGNTGLTGSGTSLATAFPANVTNGNLLLVSWRRGIATTLVSVADNMGVGNVWTTVYDVTGGSCGGGWAFVFAKGTGACTVTVTLSGADVIVAGIAEYHGPNAVRTTSAVLTDNSVHTVASTNSITASAGDLLISSFIVGTGNASVTAGGIFTKRVEAQSAGLTYVLIEDILNASVTGAASASATWGTAVGTSIGGIGAFFFNPYSFVQGSGTTTAITSATMSKAFVSNVTTGNLLVSTLRHGQPTPNVNSVSDNMGVGNTWQVIYDQVMPGGLLVNSGWAFCFSKGTGACTVSWNLASSGPGGVVAVAEWHGPDRVRPAPGMNGLTTATTIATLNTTVFVGDMVVGAFGLAQLATAVAAIGSASPFTLRASGTDTGNTYCFITDSLAPIPGSQNAGATLTGAQNGTGNGIGVFYSSTNPTIGSGIGWVNRHRKFINKR